MGGKEEGRDGKGSGGRERKEKGMMKEEGAGREGGEGGREGEGNG